ncbi:porin family protein [Parabacteroides sp. AM08-6]|uniref:outer membrane beta-barrel protein n=1 Tax=Parabacteroides sp. AM08-6 TaxID=2292053 RepID=UPI000F00BCE6|nr:porin family protein [Parabacteroides sp. AM08-6]RHJ83434.1 hypothetical protein DW103_06810 [Parabacteroides sp. AM08-6]
MKENNDILQMLRNREDEFHLPLRNDGWEKLEAALTSQQTEQLLPVVLLANRRKLIFRWTVAAAVLLCLLLSVPFFIPKESSEIVSENLQPEYSVSTEQVAEEPNQTVQDIQTVSTNHTEKSISATTPVSPVVIDLFPEIQLADIVVALPDAIAIPSKKSVVAKHKDLGPQPEKTGIFYTNQANLFEKHKNNHWSLGLQAGSNSLSATKGGFHYMEQELTDPGPGPDPEDPEYKPGKPENPGQGEDNKTNKIQTKAASGGGSGSIPNNDRYYYYHHHLPINVSFSLRRNLFSHIAIETGLSYTYLYSELIEEKKGDSGNQKLHYLGIPLKANWTFYETKTFSIYASAGIMIEYCISASNTLNELKIKRWQPSWNAGIGMQVKVAKPWSIFAEPGISYYYIMNPNQRNSLMRFETIRMVHPFTFNLQLGVRFTY